MRTFKERMWRRLRRVLVPENHLLLRMRDEKVVQVYQAGRYVFIRPFSEWSLPVFIGPRFVNYTIVARSCEGIPLTVGCKVAFTFDPRKGQADWGLQLARAAAEGDAEKVFGGLIEDAAGAAIRHVLGSKQVMETYNGSHWGDLEAAMSECLVSKVEMLGIALLPPIKLSLLHISAPPYVENSVALLQKRAIMTQNLHHLPIESIERYLVTEQVLISTLEKGGNVHIGSPFGQLGESVTNLVENWDWAIKKRADQGVSLVDLFVKK